ncbi:hypothetical protein BGZ47_011001 [Haplosporangium gracile]|nr:hypothetical protein BGZ47_011001 [Haplosporangium gracile]
MWGVSSVFVDGHVLYVRGDLILQQSSPPTMISTSITFSLELSTAWETSRPNFTLMTAEGLMDYLFTSTLISNDNANVLQSVLYGFLPSNDASLIQFVPTSGDAPTARQGHCMVSAYGGAKMIVFGGFGNRNLPLGDIYILESNSPK